jgi:hypothetical protein
MGYPSPLRKMGHRELISRIDGDFVPIALYSIEVTYNLCPQILARAKID